MFILSDNHKSTIITLRGYGVSVDSLARRIECQPEVVRDYLRSDEGRERLRARDEQPLVSVR